MLEADRDRAKNTIYLQMFVTLQGTGWYPKYRQNRRNDFRCERYTALVDSAYIDDLYDDTSLSRFRS